MTFFIVHGVANMQDTHKMDGSQVAHFLHWTLYLISTWFGVLDLRSWGSLD